MEKKTMVKIGLLLLLFVGVVVLCLKFIKHESKNYQPVIEQEVIDKNEYGLEWLTADYVMNTKDELCDWANTMFSSDNKNRDMKLSHYSDCYDDYEDKPELKKPFSKVEVFENKGKTMDVKISNDDNSVMINLVIIREPSAPDRYPMESFTISYTKEN